MSRVSTASVIILQQPWRIDKMKNKKNLIIGGVCVAALAILAAIGANLPENRQDETPSATTTNATETTTTTAESSTEKTLTEPSEHGTSEYVDYLYYKAKEDAKTATDEDLQSALDWLKNNTEHYFDNQDSMELAMYYGELLEMKYKDTGNEYEKLGWQAYKTIKYVYRGVESVSDEVTQNNLSELLGMVLNAENIMPTTSVTEATTPSSENLLDDEATKELIVSILKENMQKGFGNNCNVEYNEELDSYVVSAWNDGLAEYAMFSEDLTEWNSLINSLKSTSELLLTSTRELDPDANITLNILNDLNTDNVILMVYNGDVVYNARNDS